MKSTVFIKKNFSRKKVAAKVQGTQGLLDAFAVFVAALAKKNGGEIMVKKADIDKISAFPHVYPHFYPNGDVGFRLVKETVQNATEAIKWQFGPIAIGFPTADAWMVSNGWESLFWNVWWKNPGKTPEISD